MLRLLFGGLLGALLGSSATLLACWVAVVIPAHRDLRALEQTLAESYRSRAAGPKAVADLQRLSAEQVTRWTAAVDDQHRRFAELQERGHEQELELLAPSPGGLWAALAVFGVAAVVVGWLRGADADAARTLDRIVALAPDPVSAGAALARPDGPRGTARVIAGAASLSGLDRSPTAGGRGAAVRRHGAPLPARNEETGRIAVPERP